MPPENLYVQFVEKPTLIFRLCIENILVKRIEKQKAQKLNIVSDQPNQINNFSQKVVFVFRVKRIQK